MNENITIINNFQNSTEINVQNISYNTSIISAVSTNNKEAILPDWFNVFYTILRLIQGFISLSVNLLTIIAIIKFPELRNSCTNYFVASLASADGLGGLIKFIQINTAYVFDLGTDSWIKACYFELFLRFASVFGNLYGMLLITIDRYIYIQWPLRYYSFVTPKRTTIAITSMWTYICIKTLLSLAFGSQMTPGMACRSSLILIYEVYIYLLLLQVYIITVTFVIIYVLIGLLVMKLNRQISQLEPSEVTGVENTAGKQVKRERQTIKVMAMVLGVYLVCYVPTTIYHGIMATKTQTMAVVIVSR